MLPGKLDIIPIPPPLYRAAGILAEMRYEMNRQLRTPGAQHFGEINEMERTGILAELVFAMWLGIWPGNAFGTTPDNGVDYVVRGWRVDVKGTPNPDGDLLAFSHKKLGSVDMYALVLVMPKACRMLGWDWAGEVLRDQNVINTGYSRSHCIKQAQLRPMSELRKILLEGKHE